MVVGSKPAPSAGLYRQQSPKKRGGAAAVLGGNGMPGVVAVASSQLLCGAFHNEWQLCSGLPGGTIQGP